MRTYQSGMLSEHCAPPAMHLSIQPGIVGQDPRLIGSARQAEAKTMMNMFGRIVPVRRLVKTLGQRRGGKYCRRVIEISRLVLFDRIALLLRRVHVGRLARLYTHSQNTHAD